MINIKEPFYTAGKKFGWQGKSIGLGINLRLLDGDGDLELTVGDSKDIWTINKNKARELVNRYQSYYQARGTRLGVLPWYEFEKVQEKVVEVVQPAML